MTKQEFHNTFSPMALIHWKSIEAIKSLEPGYYKELKDFSVNTFYHIMQELSQNYNPKAFPTPTELKASCSGMDRERPPDTRETYFNSNAYRTTCDSSPAREAHKKFIEDLGGRCARLEETGKHICKADMGKPMMQAGYMIGQVLIARPYQLQKEYEAKHNEV